MSSSRNRSQGTARRVTAVTQAHYRSPIGILEIVGTDQGILSVNFIENAAVDLTAPVPLPAVIQECLKQLDEYFRGGRKSFSLSLSLSGTDFQERVWRRLLKIPFGQTASYRDLAEAVGSPGAFRAVGGANHRNPISIIVPCHRVVGHSGGLVGYGGGLWRKEWLLRHECARLRFS